MHSGVRLIGGWIFMTRIKQIRHKLAGYGILCVIALFVSWGIFTWISQVNLNQKMLVLSDGMNGDQTTVAELFGIKQDEFFCLEPIFLDRPSERHDYSSLIQAGMSMRDIPDYNNWPFEIVFWDPDDIRVMALSSKGKIQRKYILARDVISSGTWPRHYGCFESTHAVKITFRYPKNKKGIKLGFPDILQKNSQE